MSPCFRWSVLTVLLTTVAMPQPARAQGRGEVTVAKAMEVLDEMSRKSSSPAQVPPKILRGAQGIAIIPDQFKAGFVFGARYGRGLVVVRQEDGTWSNPVFISSFGGSFGFQAGAQATDLVLVFRGRKSVDSFLRGKGKLTMGVDASVAAGPIGRAATAGTDLNFRAEILSYSRNRGVFGGVSAGGGSLSVDRKVNADYYGMQVGPPEILAARSQLKPPTSAADLKRLLNGITQSPSPKGEEADDKDEDATKHEVEIKSATKVEGAYTPGDSGKREP
jgi:lipid-binding SYLF domain-containing protein